MNVEALRDDEVTALLRAAAYSPIGVLMPFAVYSGLRRGEILGLQWGDVDFESETVIVRRSQIVTTDGTILDETPKTESAVRMVALPRPAVEALRAARHEQLDAGRTVSWNDHVFRGPDGQPFRPDYISQAFREIRERAGVRALSFHALRYTAAVSDTRSPLP